MAGEEKEHDGASSAGTDWEVVSLTASIYAASSGPISFDQPSDSKDMEFNKDEKEAFDPVFMSRHFGFTPAEYESLKLEAKQSEIKFMEEDVFHNKEARYVSNAKRTLEKSCKTKSDDSLHGIQFFEKEKEFSVSDVGFGEGKALQGQILFDTPEFDTFHTETDVVTDGSSPCNEEADIPDPIDPSYQQGDSTPYSVNASAHKEENKYFVSGIPCRVWWKKQAMVLYNRAKEAKTVWSIFVAAALVGLVILGHRKNRAKPLVEPLKLHVSVTEEGVTSTWEPVSRFRSAMLGDHQFSRGYRGIPGAC